MNQEPPTHIEAIWYSTVDNATYEAWVERTGPYDGELVVARVRGHEIHREPTKLAFGAIYGPDVDDVATWQHRVCNIIDTIAKLEDVQAHNQ